MCFGLFCSKIFFKAFALSFPHQQVNQYCQQLIPEEGRHSWEALSIMSPVGYCLNILETLPNLLTVLSSESRKQIQFSLLIIGLFRSPAAVWKGLMETCLPLRAVAAVQADWGNMQKAGVCFSPVPLRCNPATGQLLRTGTGLRMGAHLSSSLQMAPNTLVIHSLQSALLVVQLYATALVVMQLL